MQVQAQPKSSMTAAQSVLLKIHLYLGLAAAIFLLILGLTGSIIAFELEIERWAHPSLWYAKVGSSLLPEQDLVQVVERQYTPARVTAIQIPRQADVVQVMQMSDRSTVMVNPYDGTIQGRRTGPSDTQRFLAKVHQIHLRLAPDPRTTPTWAKVGKVIINYAGLVLVILVPTGLFLWWRTKRASIKWGASWYRVCFDAHQVMGIYAGLFLFVAAVTGVLIGFDFGEEIFLSMTHSERPGRMPQMTSAPAVGAPRITADQAMQAARGAIPQATVAGLQIPLNAKGTYTVQMRVPEEVTESVHGAVVVDQFSGQVLHVRNFMTDSLGYRYIRFNRAIHTGDVLGTPTHILMSLSSLLLVGMVITGLVIWLKKLAV
jgi:uncharacterized iron-regulated membrane protein